METLAGFLLTRLGKIPTGEETVDFEGRRFTVLEMSDHRISQVRVERLENQLNEAEEGSSQETGAVKTGVVARVQVGRDPGKNED